MRFRKNYSLDNLNTFHLKSTAKYYTELTSRSQLNSLTSFINYHKCKYFILGGGSNILVPVYYDGLVIHNKIDGYRIVSNLERHVLISANAGMRWDKFVAICVKNGWYGIENLSLIPGTVGAAPIQNIGAYGVEVGNVIERVQVYDFVQNKIIYLSNQDCKFEYRNSILKNNSRYLVLSVTFKLCLDFIPNTSYPDLSAMIVGTKKLTATKLREYIIHIRKSKLPDPKKVHNVGSFFHNPIVSLKHMNELKNQYPSIPVYRVGDDSYKISAGWLIDNLGMRGFVEPSINKNIQVYNKHALILVNYGIAIQNQLLDFVMIIQNKVFELYQIRLNIEPIIK